MSREGVDFGIVDEIHFTYSLNSGWNMVSLPISISNASINNIIPNRTGEVYKYDISGYETCDTLKNGIGYWVKFDSGYDEQRTDWGLARISDTIAVYAGWNLVGSITSPIEASSVTSTNTSIKSMFFKFDKSYIPVDYVEPGNGYWVKVDSEGVLFYSDTTEWQALSKSESERGLVAQFNKLTFSTASGCKQTLYIGKKPYDSFSPDYYELPPAPPEGIFDARFESQNMLEVYSEKIIGSIEFTINLSSHSYPITILWDKINECIEDVTLSDAEGGNKIGKIYLEDNREVIIDDPSIKSLKISISERQIPTQYLLHQSYPNPFNPTATILYDLPNVSRVKLVVFNILGQVVTTLIDAIEEAGCKTVHWNANDYSSGVYFYRIEALNITDISKSFTNVKKIMLLK